MSLTNNSIAYIEKKLKIASTFLDRWQNSSTKVWEFTLTHSHITFRLEKLNQKGNLHIVCIDPIFFHGKFNWENCIFNLTYEDNIFKLKDVGNDIIIECTEINFYENCKPIW